MEHFLESWGYLAVFGLSLVSAVGIPVGAEVAIIYGGVLSSGKIPHEPHHLNLILVIVVAVTAELLGSLGGYCIGRFGGRPVFDRLGKYVLLTHRDLDRAEGWFHRRGESFVLFGRLIPLLRTFVSFAAGLAEMAVPKFLVFTAIGCLIWLTVLASVGYSLGASYEHVLSAFSYAGYLLAAVAVLGFAVLLWLRLRALRAERVG